MPTADQPPAVLAAGDSIDFRWPGGATPAPTWTATWRIIGAATGLPLTLTSTASGSDFIVTATATATAAITVPARGLPATLVGAVASGAERITVYSAPLHLQPNPLTITGDLRGHAARTLEAIEAMLEGRATKDQQSYRIGDRELSRIPIPELIQLREYYLREKRREDDAAALASGRPRSPRAILTRMARA